MRAFFFATALSFSTASLACPQADAAAAAASREAVANAVGTKSNFKVEGMTCGTCSDKVTVALIHVEGVKASSVDHETGIATVVYDAGLTNVDTIASKITESGFKASLHTN